MLVNIMSDFESRSKKNNIPLIAGVQIKGDDDTDSEESSARDIGTFAYYDVRGGWMDIDPKALSKKFPYNDNVSESDIDYLRTNISKIKDENSRNLALKRLDEESRAYSNDKIKKVNGWENLETVRPMISSSYLKSSGYGKTVLDHEFGHHIFQNRDDIREKTRTIFRSLQDDGIKSASIYGETNDTEWFAENYTLHVNGRDDLVHPKLLPVIKDLV